MNHHLITGGARSGKSRRALALAESFAESASKSTLTFVATAQAFDDEMQQRIDAHKLERGSVWHVQETPIAISTAIESYGEGDVVLIDCLTLWLSNLFMAEADLVAETANLIAVTKASSASIIFVSNEVGMGIVPETALGREFRDAQGRLNQQLAAAVGTVEFVVAGIPLVIKQP